MGSQTGFDILHGILNRSDLPCVIVWDFNLELILCGHNDLNHIEGIKTKIID
jgi:hypothetical protein